MGTSWTLKAYRLMSLGTSLKARIVAGAVATTVAVAAYGFYSLHAHHRLAVMVKEVMDVRILAMLSAEHAKQAFFAYDDALFRHLATRAPRSFGEMRDFQRASRLELGRLTSLAQTDTVRARIGLLKKESERYFEDAERLVDTSRKARMPDGAGLFQAASWARSQDVQRLELALLSEEGQARLVRIFGLCDELVTVNRFDLEASQREMDAILAEGRRNAAWGACAVGLLVCGIAMGLALSLTGPVENLLEGVRRIEKGDLEFQIPSVSNDELGELTQAFNRMTATVREHRTRLEQEVVTDALTGAYNRRWFEQALGREIERAKRLRKPVSLLVVDIDHFKEYNDSRGHEFGDEVLRRMGSALKEALREMDFLARYGGDEFVAILPGASCAEGREVAARMLAAADKAVVPGFADIRVTISVGGACWPDDADDAAELLARADEALYAAKDAGRACARWIKEGSEGSRAA